MHNCILTFIFRIFFSLVFNLFSFFIISSLALRIYIRFCNKTKHDARREKLKLCFYFRRCKWLGAIWFISAASAAANGQQVSFSSNCVIWWIHCSLGPIAIVVLCIAETRKTRKIHGNMSCAVGFFGACVPTKCEVCPWPKSILLRTTVCTTY